jgi:hypothetical protein
MALTTAVSAGGLFFLSTLQADNLIVVYNQSAARLDAIRRDWMARQPSDDDQRAIGVLVEQVESVLTTERSGWVQQMSTTVAEQQAGLAAQRGSRGEAHDLSRS